MRSKYIIKNCPACQIEPSCCTEWHLKNGEWKDCENINDCLLKRIVEKCREVNTKFYDSVHQRYLSPSKAKFAREIMDMLDIEECE